MKKEDYLKAQDQVVQIARMASEVDVDPMLEAIAKADTIGPFVDPTLWIRGHEKLGFIKELALGVKRLKEIVAANRDRILAIEVREAARQVELEEDAGYPGAVE